MTDTDTDTEGPSIEKRTLKPPTDMGEYEIRHEEWKLAYDDQWVPIESAHMKNGDYIGDPDTAAMLTAEGITPEHRLPGSTVCSIGFNYLTQRWYGWSHRAMCSFALGDVVAEGDVVAHDSDESDSVDPGFVVRTLADARRLACIFAEQVS